MGPIQLAICKREKDVKDFYLRKKKGKRVNRSSENVALIP
jgi:hypothetical protein